MPLPFKPHAALAPHPSRAHLRSAINSAPVLRFGFRRVSTFDLRMTDGQNSDGLNFRIGDEGAAIQITDRAHRQIADFCGIPWRYYARCLTESPRLLAYTVNYWLGRYRTDRDLEFADDLLTGFHAPGGNKL